MKPFLLLATRPEDDAADDEYRAFLRFGGLDEGELVRRRLERDPLGRIDLDDWSGVLLGGGPFNAGDPPPSKSADQLRVEAELHGLLDAVLATGTPFLGCCYGVGTLGTHQGAVVDRSVGEPVGAVKVELTAAGRQDPLFGVLPPVFQAFVGHKEGISSLPPHAVHLAQSPACPVQAFRIGPRAYATQFHPELDADGLCVRVEVYKHHGYFAPAEVAELQAAARSAAVDVPPRLLERFVRLFARATR